MLIDKGRHKQHAMPTAVVVRALSTFKIFIDLSYADEPSKIEYIYIYIYIYILYIHIYIIYTYMYTYILYIHIHIRYSKHPSKHYFLKEVFKYFLIFLKFCYFLKVVAL